MSNNHLAIVDPELAPLIAALPTPPLPPDSPVDLKVVRARMTAMFTNTARANLAPFLPPGTCRGSYHVEEYQIPNDAGQFAIRTYHPAAQDEKTFPTVVVVHGGGFMNGDLEMEDYSLKILYVDLQLAIVNVDYRLAPENPYPAGLNDVYQALKWTARNAALIHADLRKGFLQALSEGLYSTAKARVERDRSF
ncbi:Alpha/Beta hydrolase protein [Trametes polyzona]|nr:Alpha/Beta hydrolase protein [Trametes polyzona]